MTRSTDDPGKAIPLLPADPLRDDLRVCPVQIDIHVLRQPIATPVRTSFGVMHERPAVLIRVLDADGHHGWGEAWCNFPGCGAEHRARLIQTVLAPLLAARTWKSPRDAWQHLSDATAVLAIQSGEHGPLAQAIAGIDLALWDLVARRAKLPLWRLFGGQTAHVGLYASGLNPQGAAEVVAQHRARGYRAFKLKVGFGMDRDLDNLAQVAQAAGSDAHLMVDANQAWDLDAASQMVRALAAFDLEWIEEPLRADRPWPEWAQLRDEACAPLAAGENVTGREGFARMMGSRAVGVVQPDIAKWGGHSGTWPVILDAHAAGLRYCPHYLGAGIGLLHSAHLLSAALARRPKDGARAGWLEVDANDNPLRTELWGPLGEPDADGCATLGEAPGIGVEPAAELLREVAAQELVRVALQA